MNRVRRFVGAFGGPAGLAGACIVAALLLAAVFAPLIAPYDPLAVSILDKLLPPDDVFLLGTDQSGRDILSRVIWGARASLTVSGSAVVIGVICGVSIGMFATYVRGGWLEQAIMRVLEAVSAIPLLIWALMKEKTRPSAAEWARNGVIGAFLFLGGHGSLAWAELHVPTGLAALILTTMPLWMAMLDALRARLPDAFATVGVRGCTAFFVGGAVRAQVVAIRRVSGCRLRAALRRSDDDRDSGGDAVAGGPTVRWPRLAADPAAFEPAEVPLAVGDADRRCVRRRAPADGRGAG